MPISAEQWRASTGSINNFRAPRTLPASHPALNDLPSPPPSSWKGYSSLLVLLSVPLIYKIYFAVIMFFASGATHRLTIGTGSTCNTSTVGYEFEKGIISYESTIYRLSLFLLSAIFYVTMVILVVLVRVCEHKGRDKHQWTLTKQLHHLDVYWLNCGRGCEIIYDSATGYFNAILTFELKSECSCTSKLSHIEVPHYCCPTKASRHLAKKIHNCTLQWPDVKTMIKLSTLVVVMLLLLAGDVERNPGPITGPHNTRLNEQDVGLLVELLASYASKWQDIGLQLGFTVCQLDTISASPPGQKAIDYLRAMLGEWVQWTPETAHGKHATLEDLLVALRSNAVNLGTVADDLCLKCKQSWPLHHNVTARGKRGTCRQSSSGHGNGNESLDDLENGKEDITGIPAMKKTRYNYQHLDLSKYDTVEANLLQKRLNEEYADIRDRFQKLVNTLTDSIIERGHIITVAKVLRCISEHTKTVPPVITIIGHEELPLSIQYPNIMNTKSIDELMLAVSEYSSFFSFGIIKQITESLGTDNDKAKLKEYEKYFDLYAERTVYECPELGIPCSEGRTSFLIKVDDGLKSRWSLKHLLNFLNKVSEILNLKEDVISIESVAPGCLELILHVPKLIHQHIFPLKYQQEEDLAALGVIQITAGVYQYPSHQDDNKYDKPDDEPADSGIDTLSTVTNELTELKKDVPFSDEDKHNPYDIHVDINKPEQKSTNWDYKDTGSKSVTLLHIAAFFGKLDHVKFLVKLNPLSLHQTDSLGNTALHYAVIGNKLDVLKYFVDDHSEDCNPMTFGEFGETALHMAARQGYFDILKYLISDWGADPMSKSRSDYTVLHSACIGGSLEVVQYLVERLKEYFNIQIIANDTTKLGHTYIHFAANYGHIEVLKYFISDIKCDPNVVEKQYQATPLHYAASGGHIETVKYLIDVCKCEPSPLNYKNETPLHYAAVVGHLRIISFLTLEREFKDVHPQCKESEFGNTPLHYAAHRGHIELVHFFLKTLKCDLDTTHDQKGSTPLHAAAHGGHVTVMNVLIDEYKCDPSVTNSKEETPTFLAAEMGHLGAVKFLVLSKKCDPEHRNSDGETPLHLAALNGHINVMEFLIEEMHCDRNIKDFKNGLTPFHAAAEEGRVEVMQYLINKNCDPCVLDSNKLTPLHYAAENGKLNAVKFLTLNNYCDHNCRNSDEDTPLHLAAIEGYTDVVKFFISELKCDSNIRDKNGYTPLHDAALNNRLEVVKYLTKDVKCNPAPADNENNTPLHWAAHKGYLNIISFFTQDCGCNPCTSSNLNGFTPFHVAVSEGHLNIVKFFICTARCDPNSPVHDKNFKGLTPLHVASLYGHIGMVIYLINECQCDPSQVDHGKLRSTPLHSAAIHDNVEIVKLLTMEYGCNPYFRDAMHNTPLHFAALYGSVNTIKFFASKLKCDLNILGANGATPLHTATIGGHIEIVKYLINEKHCDTTRCLENPYKTPLLHLAVQKGHLKIVKFLTLEKQCKPLDREKLLGHTSVHTAAMHGQLSVLRFLIEHLGCPHDLPAGPLQFKPMQFATMGSHHEIVKYLQNVDLARVAIHFYERYTELIK